MKMRKQLSFLLAVLCIILCGCNAQTPSQDMGGTVMKLYYVHQTPSFAQKDGALCPEDYTFSENPVDVQTLLTAYLRGPYAEGSKSALSDEALILDYSEEDGEVRLVFNDGFYRMSSMERTVAAAALTYTLTELESVERVAFYSRSGSGETLEGIYSRGNFLLYDDSTENPSFTETLYFTNEKGELKETTGTIYCASKEKLPEAVMQTLLAGPERTLRTAIPQQTKLLDVSVSVDLVTVVLSEEFSQCDTSERTAKTAVMQIVRSLCALDGVQSVQIGIVGDLGLSHFDISQPLTPESE